MAYSILSFQASFVFYSFKFAIYSYWAANCTSAFSAASLIAITFLVFSVASVIAFFFSAAIASY